jgi:hypothetical protein
MSQILVARINYPRNLDFSGVTPIIQYKNDLCGWGEKKSEKRGAGVKLSTQRKGKTGQK